MKERGFVTGEASPYYVFHPHAPSRIAKEIPNVKLIVLLRNPVDRAYSHYQKSVRKGFESLPFEDAIEKEEQRLRGETDKMLENEHYYSLPHQKYSYLSRGVYVNQLTIWMPLFPKKNILIFKSEDFYTDPKIIVTSIFNFLNLPPLKAEELRKPIYPKYPKMNVSTRHRLIEFFSEHNQKLYKYLGLDFDWDT